MQKSYAQRCVCGLWLFGLIIAVVAAVATLTALFFKALGDIDTSNEYYGPTDTRIVSIFSTMCEGAELRVGETEPGYQVHLYTLNSTPVASQHSTFQLPNEQPFIQYRGDYQYYRYYMLNGSSFNVSACILGNKQPNVTSYVIKGRKDFEDLLNGKKRAVLIATINSQCQSSNNSYSYSVVSDDFYFLVFDADGEVDGTLNVTLSFDLLHHDIQDHTIIEECHLNTSFKRFGICSVAMPLSGNVTTLMQVTPGENTTNIDWKFSASAEVSCSPRIWMYVVIGFSILIGIAGPFTSLCILCKVIERRGAKYGSINATKPLLSPPPSYDYGSGLPHNQGVH